MDNTLRKLGRLPEVDERSRLFRVKNLLHSLPPRSFTWGCDVVLDQGSTSACVGFSWAHQLIATPAVVSGVTLETALSIYDLAQDLDQYPGDAYDGTSVIAGVKAVLQLFPQAFDSYHWAFGIEDVVTAIGYVGPVILGINWYDSMYHPDSEGNIKVEGRSSGGHAILATGVDVQKQTILLHNSWGVSYGKNGQVTISLTDLSRLLGESGEALVAVGQHAFTIGTNVLSIDSSNC